MGLNSIICQSFPVDEPLWSCLHLQNVRQISGRWPEIQSRAIKGCEPHAAEQESETEFRGTTLIKTQQDRSKWKKYYWWFSDTIILSFWACLHIAYSKSWLTRESKRVFHLRKMVGHHFQRMDLMLLGNISTFKWQQVKTSKRVENTRPSPQIHLLHTSLEKTISSIVWF